MYLDIEDSIALLKLEVKAREELLSIYDKIIEVVRSFDGKQLNVRLERALQEVDAGLYAGKDSCGNFEIEYFIRTDGVQCANSSGYVYLNNRRFTLIRCIPSIILKGNRIDANLMIGTLLSFRNSLSNEAKELRNSIPKINDMIIKQRELVAQLTDFRKEIPYLIKDYVTELSAPHIY